MTKDERFLIEFYRTAKGSIDRAVDLAQIAKKLNYKEHLTKEIIKGLCQANLIKVEAPEEAFLTERGLEVAHSLL